MINKYLDKQGTQVLVNAINSKQNALTFDATPTTNSTNPVTSGGIKTYVDTAIGNLPAPMVFKGTLGTSGTITTLPVNGTASVGDTYKVITDGTYASKAAKVGDTFICLTKTNNANTWELIPSGDEPAGTVTSVGMTVPTGLSVSGTPVTSSGTLAVSYANGYSIPTTAKQAEWDEKLTYYDLDQDPNIAPIFGGDLPQADLNTACEYLLTVLNDNSEKTIYRFNGYNFIRVHHEGLPWNDGGSTNPFDACNIVFEMIFPSGESMGTYILGRSSDGNWGILEQDITIQEELVSGTNIKTINNTSLLGPGNISIDVPTAAKQAEWDEKLMCYDLGQDPNIAPIFGGTPSGADLNAACEALLTVLNDNSEKAIYRYEGYNLIATRHEGLPWNDGGSANPSDTCNITLEIAMPMWATLGVMIMGRNDNGNWEMQQFSFPLQPQVSGSGNAITGVNYDTANGSYILEKNATFQEQLVSGTNIKTINNTSLLGSGNISITIPASANTRAYRANDCTNAAGTVAKTASCSNYVLAAGSLIAVKFTNTNTAASATLNLASTGAKTIRYNNAALTTATAGVITAGSIVTFIYDGSYYHIINVSVDGVAAAIPLATVQGWFA